MPQSDQRRDMEGATGKEVNVAKRRGASVNSQTFPHEAQVKPLVRQQTALGKFLPHDLQAGNFAGGQLLLDGRIKITGGKTEILNRINPLIPNISPLVLESKDEVNQAPQSFALFWLVLGSSHG